MTSIERKHVSALMKSVATGGSVTSLLIDQANYMLYLLLLTPKRMTVTFMKDSSSCLFNLLPLSHVA